MRIGIDDIDRYQSDGYVLTTVLDRDGLDSVLAETERLRTLASDLEHSTGDFNLEAPGGGYTGQNGARTGYRGVLRKISNAVRHSSVVLEISRRPSMTAFARGLLGDRPCELAHSVLWYKPPAVGSPKPPHQDAPYLSGNPTNYLTIWIALDDATPESGCLSVVPGSHRHGLLPHHGVEAQVSQDRWAQEASAQLPLAGGGAVAFHPYLLHASGPNRSDRPRRALTLRYVVSDIP
jgi:ectoine hydroxylase-related dioxygenase (phytanoyl-CoA dioxygenase family)